MRLCFFDHVLPIGFKLQDNSPFHGLFFSFALQYNPKWMRGNLGLKLQNTPKLPNREKGYCGELITVQNIDSWRNLEKYCAGVLETIVPRGGGGGGGGTPRKIGWGFVAPSQNPYPITAEKPYPLGPHIPI